jgi:hypothetical protein
MKFQVFPSRKPVEKIVEKEELQQPIANEWGIIIESTVEDSTREKKTVDAQSEHNMLG